jgi:hypothetical protein
MNAKLQAALASYARAAVGAALAVYMTGNTNPSDWGKAAIAALVPPLLRWVNPSDGAFGITKEGK